MPIYEYECEKCHHQLEALQKISDKPLRECPECGRHALKRLVSAPLFRLTGSGWYETDFKSDKETKRNLAGKEEAAAAEPAKDTATTGDKKPAEAKPAESKPRKTMVTKPVAAAKPAQRSRPVKAPVRRAPAKKPARRR